MGQRPVPAGTARLKPRAHPDFAAALLFALLGAIGLLVARTYPLGTTMRMGPGYLPMAVSGLLVLVAAAIALDAWRDPSDVAPEPWRPAPIAAILASLGAFALLIEPLGLIGATVVLLAVARFATRPVRPVELVALALGGAAFSAAVFVYLLNLPIALWPRWWSP